MIKLVSALFTCFCSATCFAQTYTSSSSGYVGIATTTPSENLDVKGNIRTNRLRKGSSIFSANSRT